MQFPAMANIAHPATATATDLAHIILQILFHDCQYARISRLNFQGLQNTRTFRWIEVPVSMISTKKEGVNTFSKSEGNIDLSHGIWCHHRHTSQEKPGYWLVLQRL